ncbi:MAG: ATP-binding protein [Prevotella sp.]|nr:ATP-binding protein [Prevotella sp.]
MKFQQKNPFVEYGYFGNEYFCDREQETESLISALQNGSNVTLMAPRRIGKTGLILHTFERLKQIQPKAQCFYVDIFPTKNLQQMVQLMATTILGKLDTPSQSVKRKLDLFVSSLRPTMSFDKLDGTPTMSFNIVPTQAKETLSQIFEYIKLSERPCYLAIDEFQQVATYSDGGIDAYIRSIIQFIPNLRIIFSGSQQHLLAEMFMSPKHPFFNSSQIMSLDVIPQDAYLQFANGFFQKQKRTMSSDDFAWLYELVDGQTWYIQKTLNRIYRYEELKIDHQLVVEVIDMIITEQEVNYQNNYNLLTENQALLLTAVAHEGIVKTPTSLDFVMRYGLPAPSSIKVALKSLTDKELLYHDTQRGYLVYDRFFGLWLQRR